VVLLLVQSISDVTRSLASQYVNDRIESSGRATVLSTMAMVSGLAVIPFQLGSGVLSDLTSPLTVIAVGGIVLAVGAIAIHLWEPPVPRDVT
jgi:Cu/Ag efflux pump CusA